MGLNYKFCLWNSDTKEYDFAYDFNKAVWLCETIYNFQGEEWSEVAKSNDLYMIESYLNERGIESEVRN